MERDFWILLAGGDDDPGSAAGARSGGDSPLGVGGRPFLQMSRLHAYESALPVFSSEEKAVAFSRHVGEQHHAGEVPTPTKLTQRQIQKRVFGGDPRGDCVVDPAPDRPGREVAVGDLLTA